jgi:hypothetical protein
MEKVGRQCVEPGGQLTSLFSSAEKCLRGNQNKRSITMCDTKKCCEKPDQLKGKPQECTTEQISMCHGDVKTHPCISNKGCQEPVLLKDTPEACSSEQIRKCHGDVKGHPCL